MAVAKKMTKKAVNPDLLPRNGEQAVNIVPKSLIDIPTHFCPGCHHGIAHRLVAELLDEMSLREKAVCMASVGCSAFIYKYLDIDVLEAPHGRGPAAGTGVKRARPECFVFTFQGDGDLAAIGIAEIIHAANRGERISVVFINNSIYGMTGGQMAPTTLLGQKTTTTTDGRNQEREGGPIRMAEIIAGLDGTAYAARVSLHSARHIRDAKKAIRRAFEVQEEGLGTGFVEILSTCPTNWRMDALRANERIAMEMIPAFPLGTYKDVGEKDKKGTE